MKRITLAFLMIFFITGAYAQTVTVSIPPQKYIVEKIVGNTVKVNVIVPAGSDPHSFAPKSAQIKALSDSALYLGIGFPFEKSMIPQIAESMKNLKIVKTQEGIALLEHNHEHEEEGMHEEEEKHTDKDHELDPHVWTSPKSMLIVAENTYNALTVAFPQFKSTFDTNYRQLKNEITLQDSKFTALFASGANKTFLVYHPAYGYLARDYGLAQLEVERNGKDPKAAELKEILNTAKNAKVKLFIISPQQSSAAAQTIAKELGINLTVINNLDGNWGNMTDTLYKAFGGNGQQ